MGIRDHWLTTAEYAATAGITQQTVRRWAAEGRIEARRVGRRLDVRDWTSSSARAAACARELLGILANNALARELLADVKLAELLGELEKTAAELLDELEQG